MLTKGLGRPDCAAQGTGGEVRAAKMTRSSGRSRCGRLWVPRFPWFASWSCCGDATGVRAGMWSTGGEKTEMAAELTCVGSRPN